MARSLFCYLRKINSLIFPLQTRIMHGLVLVYDSGSSGQDSSLGQGTALCSWARHFSLKVPLFTQVYEWLSANLIAKRAVDVILRQTNFKTQTNKPEWRTIAFLKRVSPQYSKTTFLKRKLHLHSLYSSQNMLMLSELSRVPVICILFLDFARNGLSVE